MSSGISDVSPTRPNLSVIEIDGASPGMGIMHLLGEVGDDLDSILARVKVGTRFEAVWKPRDGREGSITDIRYFRPVASDDGGRELGAACGRK